MRALALALVLLGVAAPFANGTRTAGCPRDASLGSVRFPRAVRERNGYGRLMLWRAGHIIGPFAHPGYSLRYYGHHAWHPQWSAAA